MGHESNPNPHEDDATREDPFTEFPARVVSGEDDDGEQDGEHYVSTVVANNLLILARC